jgi:ABC-2 type transport system ATP-binding protein
MGVSSEHVVELHDVTKRFGAQLAVERLSLAIPKGSIYGFIGPNGSGKTTTIRMILRIYRPDAGRVMVLGRDRGDTADDRVGYLPEERGLYPKMTVRRLLRYFGRLKGIHRPDATIDQWLERLGATQWANKKIDQLSKGMAQKVQFIAAVAAAPQLVILDEPFTGLDPVNLDLLRDAVKELRDRGTTVILSTHDMEVAQNLCDSVLMIFRGRKVLDGPMDTIRDGHGQPRLRIRMADQRPLPNDLPGVTMQSPAGRSVDLMLESPAARPAILQRLIHHGDVEHFEMVRPNLHDIFISIAGPEARTNPTTMVQSS